MNLEYWQFIAALIIYGLFGMGYMFVCCFKSKSKSPYEVGR